jgi:lactobin A/cerein 7B family class IIb bacteriocin
MRELTNAEMEEVSGGILPIIAVVCAFEIGVFCGIIAGSYA